MPAKRFTANKIKSKLFQGREHILFYIVMCLVYILFVSLIVLYSMNIEEKTMLELKFNSEQSFNAIYMALSESNEKALAAMEKNDIYAVGIYSANGTLYKGLGDAPDVLPMNELSAAISGDQDSTLGIYVVNETEKTIDYFRLSRLNVAFEIGALSVSGGTSGNLNSQDIPEIVYVKSDGTDYINDIRTVKISVFIGIVALTVLFLIIFNVYNSNRKYKKEIARNENLVKLGTAVRTLTHEIKNPLSAITIQTGLLHKLLPEEYEGDLDVIDHEVVRITNLTTRVSEFLKNPVGTPQEIELVSFISDIARLFKQEIKIDCQNMKKIHVLFDADRARSVFENLIKNATESCEGRDAEVEVVIRKKKDNVYVDVMDRGDGISDEAMKKIFDPFFTTKIHGSGIGLSISNQFVSAAGGALRISPRDGGGTIVEVELPYLSVQTKNKKAEGGKK
ncbi:MAG: HAMP domain-containing histidine kinase [Sphaerochaetaceae bacterium]|nr:HAMP domain-containing histidine kinase [Sphaerochaetaceae bacterium]